MKKVNKIDLGLFLKKVNLKTFALIIGIFIVIQPFSIYGQSQVRFAAIGDFGSDDGNELGVSSLVKSWNPDFVITLGDNNYPDGEASTIDQNIGKYYQEFIFPYAGIYGAGATTNKFFPSLGNRDWETPNSQPYLDYFMLPNNERYYDYVQGPVHFFVINSDEREPDGITSTSTQAVWLQNKLAASTSPWKIVYLHHPPYSSRTSFTKLQWDFQQWGATAVLSGHAHVYERIIKDGLPYIINGLGGESLGSFSSPIEGSVIRFGSDYGAQLITADNNSITFQFITQAGVVIDTYTISTIPLVDPNNLTATGVSSNQINLNWSDNSTNENGFKVERCIGATCTNFVEIGQTLANATTYSDSSGVADTTYNYRVRAFNANENSGYTNTASATTTSPGSTVFSDDFNDNAIDPLKWDIGIITRSSSDFDPTVLVEEVNGTLSITPKSSFDPDAFSGYLSAGNWDLTNANPMVELVQPTSSSSNSETFFSVGFDKYNWFQFRFKKNKLYLRHRQNGGSTNSVTVTYSASQHRYLRFRYDDSTDTVKFETSSDGTVWATQKTVQRQVVITAMKIELMAGTGSAISAPGVAIFDNFQLVSNGGGTPPPDAPTNLTANAPNSTQIDLLWADNSSDETGFAIERCEGVGCTSFSEITQVSSNTTSFSDTGLSAMMTYRYRVRAVRNAVNSDYSNIATAQTPIPPPIIPDDPSDLQITSVTANQINLVWLINSVNEDGFQVERCEGVGCTNFVEVGQTGVEENTFNNTGLTENTFYRYRVRAFNIAGPSGYSNIAEGTAQNPPPPPATPTDLTATAFSSSQIDLTWTDNSTDENGFKIESCQDAACVNFVEIAQVGADVTNYSNTGLLPDKTYRYRVRAFNLGGDSGYSNISEATTPDAPPLAPSSLNASETSSSQIDLTWTDSASNESGFKIERCQDAACVNFVEIAQVGSNVTNYSNIGLLSNTTYRYQVRAFNPSGDSGYSNISEAVTLNVPPTSPTVLTATAFSSSQIDLTWTDNSSNEDGFRIERCQGAACVNFVEITQVSADVTNFSNTGLSANTTYRYRVFAFNNGGDSIASNVSEAITPDVPPASPTNLTTNVFSPTQVNLTWVDNSSNEGGFKIERCLDSGCTNFAEIGQVGADVVDYSDLTVLEENIYRYRVRAFNTSGDSGYSNIADANTDVNAPLFSDDFNDGVQDLLKWEIGILSRSSSNFDPQVQVLEQNGFLSIFPRIASGNSYSGYLSTNTWDLTNSNASVELVQKSGDDASTIFSAGIDKDNWHSFRAKGSTLYIESRIDGTTSKINISYDPVLHRFLRLRHNPAGDSINFETSSDGINWTIQNTVPRQFVISAVKFELVVGTKDSTIDSGVGLFDNFRLLVNASSFSLSELMAIDKLSFNKLMTIDKLYKSEQFQSFEVRKPLNSKN